MDDLLLTYYINSEYSIGEIADILHLPESMVRNMIIDYLLDLDAFIKEGD